MALIKQTKVSKLQFELFFSSHAFYSKEIICSYKSLTTWKLFSLCHFQDLLMFEFHLFDFQVSYARNRKYLILAKYHRLFKVWWLQMYLQFLGSLNEFRCYFGWIFFNGIFQESIHSIDGTTEFPKKFIRLDT